MASAEGTSQQLEAALVVPVEVTACMEEIVTTVATDNATRPTDITMLHDYAMEHLFSFLPMADLKKCRLVNRSWNRASNRAIQNRNYLIYMGEHCGPRRLQVSKILDIPRLDQLIRTSFQFPWTKFHVQARDYVTSSMEDRLLGNLLRVINSFVNELEICYLRSLPSLDYPRLRKLTLRYDSPKGVPSGDNWTSLLRLVETASNLNEIGLVGFFNTPLVMDILEISNGKISRLSLSKWIGGEQLVRISKMSFQLKFLSLVFVPTKTTVDNLRAILESQSNCLEHLELTCYGTIPRDPWWLRMEFPCMAKLKMLMVDSAVNLYSRINYKDMFPVLKKLKVYDYDDFYPLHGSFFNEEIEPVETVEYLGCPQARSPETILQAARQFPKLRSIYLIVSPNLLNTVGHAMPQLEEMELAFNREDNMDSILTGLTSEEVDTLKGLTTDQLDVVERSMEPVLFLKNLKMLRLTRRECKTSLSDFGCRFALLKMKHLRVLELQGYFNQISDQVMERMRAKFVVRLESQFATIRC